MFPLMTTLLSYRLQLPDGHQVITYSFKGSVVAVLTVTYVAGNVSAVVQCFLMAYAFNPFTGNFDLVGVTQNNAFEVKELFNYW